MKVSHDFAEAKAVLDAVEGTPPDVRLVRARPSEDRHVEPMAQEMVRSLFLQDCEYYRITVEDARVVADGWKQTPQRQAAYVPPPLVQAKSGMAMDLTVADRQRLRHIIRATEGYLWREPPSDAMCDELIDSFGPKVAEEMVKKARDAGQVA